MILAVIGVLRLISKVKCGVSGGLWAAPLSLISDKGAA